ncbi:MAG: DUF547 domain-containing protein [Acidobacteriota bacterium]|nr:DUF547 domain-containing protein [Acidobacteriota bacterium]
MRTAATRASLFCALLAGWGLSAIGAAAAPDNAVFDAILQARARNGGFDYAGATGQDKKRLAAYLANIGDADPSKMSPDEKKAFYINAYNACAIATVLDRYPTKSILDIDGAFKKVTHKVGGEMLTLDAIENKLREDKDARIHFAIVCASKSCPPLAGRAYTAAGLSAELDRQGRAFVNDASKNSIDRQKGKVSLSKIFFWNRKEFERDGGGSLVKDVAKFLSDPAAAAWLASFASEPEFLEYDWSLNQP